MPAPTNSATFLARLMWEASSWMVSWCGTFGARRRVPSTGASVAVSSSAMSPGMVTTATPESPTAWRIAEATTRGDCSGESTISL